MERNLRLTLLNGAFQNVDENVSKKMRRILSKGTSPEKKLRKIVQQLLDYPIRINNRKLFGCPDIHVPSMNLVMFVDGCFFHGCPVHGHIPNKNSLYWKTKICNNRERDLRTSVKLRNLGFHVWRIWEHQLHFEASIRVLVSTLSHRFEKLSKRAFAHPPLGARKMIKRGAARKRHKKTRRGGGGKT